MLLKVLREHARHAVEYPNAVGGLGDDVFVMEQIVFDPKQWMEQVRAFDPGASKAAEPKFQPKLYLRGTMESGVPVVNGGNPPNAKKATMGAMPKEPSFGPPPEKGQPLDKFWDGLIPIFTVSDDEVLESGWKECAVFESDDPTELAEAVKKSALLPYRAQAADSFCYALLALHSLNVRSKALGLEPEKDLFSADLFRFLFLFRAFQLGQDKKIAFTHGGRSVRLGRPTIHATGATGDIAKYWLSVSIKDGLLGVPDQPSRSPVLNRFHKLLTEDFSSLKFNNRPYNAFATGIAPTNPFRSDKGKPVLHPKLMLGADPASLDGLIPGYGPYLTDTRLHLDGDLYYYILPDQPAGIDTGEYLEDIRAFARKTRELRQDYFKALGVKNDQEKEVSLVAWQSETRKFWENQYTHFSIGDFLFALETNVGSGNKEVFAWIQVHRGIDAVQAFLLLFHLNQPIYLPRLIGFLKRIQEGHTLGDGWVSQEIRGMVAAYFQTPESADSPFDYRMRWMAWRGYFTRANTTYNPIRSEEWEQAMAMILRLNTMHKLTFDPEQTTGKNLIQNLEATMDRSQKERQAKILQYLEERFPNDYQKEKSRTRLSNWINGRAEIYARFVETADEDQMRTILDGLIVGWGLKNICRNLRGQGDDYKLLIGGKSLARYSPTELRSLMIDLLSKSERQGKHPWNSDIPVELALLWSQKNPASPEVILFMDSVSLGFYRWDPMTENTSTTANESET